MFLRVLKHLFLLLSLVLLSCRVFGKSEIEMCALSGTVQQIQDKCAIIGDGIRFNQTLKAIDISQAGGIISISFETGSDRQLSDKTVVFNQDNSDSPLYITVYEDGSTVISTSADFIKVTSGVSLFQDLKNLTSIDISKLDFSEVTMFRNTFQNCLSLESIDLTSVNMTKCSGMFHMFDGCKSLEQVSIDGLDLSNLRTLEGAFHGCGSLKSVKIINTNTPKLMRTDMMFSDCLSLQEVDLSGLDMDEVKWSFSMFMNCPKLETVTFGDLNMSSVEWANEMFSGCESLSYLDLSGLNSEKVTNIDRIFYGAFKDGGTIRLGEQFIINDCIRDASMFENCGPIEIVGTIPVERVNILKDKYKEDTRIDFAANVDYDRVFFPCIEVRKNMYWEDAVISKDGEIEELRGIIQ